MQIIKNKNFRNHFLFVSGLILVTSVLTFNCAGPKSLSQQTGGNSNQSLSNQDVTGKSSVSLLNFNQVFNSMLNVTGQSASGPTTNETRTFNSISSLLTEVADVGNVNPMAMMATGALAGEVCNGMIGNEVGVAAAQRSYMGNIDFTRGPASLTEADYLSADNNMALKFFGRSLSVDETTLLKQYRLDYMNDLSATDKTNRTMTSRMMVATCAALLGSFDSITF